MNVHDTFFGMFVVGLKKGFDLCKLILDPVILLNLVISGEFQAKLLGSHVYILMSSANNDTLTYFPICIHFIFPSLKVIASALSTMLKRSKYSGQHSLTHDLCRIASSGLMWVPHI